MALLTAQPYLLVQSQRDAVVWSVVQVDLKDKLSMHICSLDGQADELTSPVYEGCHVVCFD